MRVVRKRLPHEVASCTVLALADLHAGDQRFDPDALVRMVRWIQEEDHRYVILNGDLIDNATRESVGDPYEAVMPPMEQKKYIVEKLTPIKDRILGVTVGNHEERSYKHGGHDPAEDIALLLGAPYAREGLFVVLQVGYDHHSRQQVVYTIYATHGWAGGKRPGSGINAAEDLERLTDADVYYTGHVHKPFAYYKSWFRPKPTAMRGDVADERLLEEVTHAFVGGGSLLAFGGYAERKGMPPAARMMPYAVFDGTRKSFEIRWLS